MLLACLGAAMIYGEENLVGSYASSA